MNKFTLTTEDVIQKGGYNLRIMTAGIDLTEFNNNPIMLYNHNSDKVIGTWTNIEKVDNKLQAEPLFDEDEESLTIKNKVEKGTIKSASIGLTIDNAYLDGDVVIVDKSTLLETSIVAIPANKKAKKLEYNNEVLQLSVDNLNKIEQLFKNMEIKLNENTPVDAIIEVPAVEVPEVKAEEVVVEEPKAEIIEEVKPNIDELKLELSAKIDNLTLKLSNSDNEVNNLKLELSSKESKILELSTKVKEYESEKMNNLLDNAVNEGKITKEAKVDFLELSYEKASSIIGKLSGTTVSLSQTLKDNKAISQDKTYDWYLKNDKEGLKKLAKDNPTLYKQLESASLKK